MHAYRTKKNTKWIWLFMILIYNCGCLFGARDDFVYYANVCFDAFGDRVKHWVTFDEANDFVPWGYAGRAAPPGRCSIPTYVLPSNCTIGDSATEPYIAAHHVLLAHASAVELYRQKYLVSRHYL